MILPNVRAVLAFNAFAGNAWTNDFRQSVIVDGMKIERFFYLGAHRIGPRFGAAHCNLERALAWVDALGTKFIKNCKYIAWCNEDDVGAEISDQAHLPLGHSARHRYDGHAEPFGAIMKSNAASEQSITVRVLHQHARLAPGGAHAARHQAGPRVEIAPTVADYSGLACRSR